MKIGFVSQKLQKIFNSENELKKEYGAVRAKKIKLRMKVLEAAVSLAEVSHEKPERRHQLKGDRKEQFAVDLEHPFRLIFKPDSKPALLPDGGIDLKLVNGIIILSVENYHDD
jgi:proteic killer suppression protein